MRSGLGAIGSCLSVSQSVSGVYTSSLRNVHPGRRRKRRRRKRRRRRRRRRKRKRRPNMSIGGWNTFKGDICTHLIFLHFLRNRKQKHIGFHPADPWGITSREAYWEFQPSYDSVRRSLGKGCSDHRFRTHPAYTASQLLTLHQHRVNNQWIGHG